MLEKNWVEGFRWETYKLEAVLVERLTQGAGSGHVRGRGAFGGATAGNMSARGTKKINWGRTYKTQTTGCLGASLREGASVVDILTLSIFISRNSIGMGLSSSGGAVVRKQQKSECHRGFMMRRGLLYTREGGITTEVAVGECCRRSLESRCCGSRLAHIGKLPHFVTR